MQYISVLIAVIFPHVLCWLKANIGSLNTILLLITIISSGKEAIAHVCQTVNNVYSILFFTLFILSFIHLYLFLLFDERPWKKENKHG